MVFFFKFVKPRSTEHSRDETECQKDLNAIYLDAKNDYRASLNLEQSILNFGVAILAICTATGFTLFGNDASWIIFAIVIPFFLSLVKVMFLHQKHRSKTYKAYILFIEQTNSMSYGFETWKQKNISKFVTNRIGFYICFIFVLFLVTPLFIVIAFFSYMPDVSNSVNYNLLIFLIIIVVISLLSDIVCVFYAISIRKLSKK